MEASPAKLRHSLRTPLNHIIGNGELLLEGFEAARPGSDNCSFREALVRVIGHAREMVKFTEQALGNETGLHAGALRELQSSLLPAATQLLAGVNELVPGAPSHLEQEIANLRFAAEQLLALARDSEASAMTFQETPAGLQADGRALGPRLLLVDDSTGNREILRRFLARSSTSNRQAKSLGIP